MSNLPPPPPTPPNWYPDPDDESQYRYWDGEKWTEHHAPRQLDSADKLIEETTFNINTNDAIEPQPIATGELSSSTTTIKERGWKGWRRRHPVWHVIFWIIVGMFLYGFTIYMFTLSIIGSSSEEDNQQADSIQINPRNTTTTLDRQAEERRKGFHCLSAWDGNHDGLEALIRDRLNDPGSMETIETVITPVDARGDHAIVLEFTAKNAFGGRVRQMAFGIVDNSTCEARLEFIE